MKQQPAKFDLVEPRASALIESLRAFGYNLPTAVADLVDNSIAAGAKNICLRTFWSGSDSYLALIDDGRGMGRTELINAMRPGSKSPTDERDSDDLGRFGLGLKTASFSQCRRMTVWSKREDGYAAVRCWDLDYVCESAEWRLLSTVNGSTKEILDSFLKPESGTIVLWEKMDRLVADTNVSDHEAQSQFHDAIDEVAAHLSMVFHRFMSTAKRISLFVNGGDKDHRLEPWDPFLSDNPATQPLPTETIQFERCSMTVEPFVLPHHDKLTKKDHKRAAGVGGWNERNRPPPKYDLIVPNASALIESVRAFGYNLPKGQG